MTSASILTVRELTAHVKRLLDRDEILQDVLVRGEISNFTRHSSGHLYFSLKDETSALSCVCFRGAASALPFAPEDGMGVIAGGSVTVYEKQGRYQLIVRFLRRDGMGDLAAALERLKEKLQKEGLFAPERKRPLPRFPRGIGIVTSPTGAAVRDLVSIISRRYPLAKVVIIPAIVQGEAGAGSIVRALERANAREDLDVLIVGRGGGSLEDLWCFNEESVARAIFGSRLPVISAVGHETDFTIADFVADVRAATPSAAAELVAPDQVELQRHLSVLGRHLRAGLSSLVGAAWQELRRAASHPVLRRPMLLIEGRQQRLDEATVELAQGARRLLKDSAARLQKAELGLRALDPMAVLGRGYAICRRADDRAVVRSTQQVAPADGIVVTVRDGDIAATVG